MRLGAIKALTGVTVNCGPKTSVLSSGTAPLAGPSAYLEDLPGQPYFEGSPALCWQYSKEATAGQMYGVVNLGSIVYPCNVALPARPAMAGQHYPHQISASGIDKWYRRVVSASGSKKPAGANVATARFDLAGRYIKQSGTIGLQLNGTIDLVDDINRLPMLVELSNTGKAPSRTELAPGPFPSAFKVDVAKVQKLSLGVTNVSDPAQSDPAQSWDSCASFGAYQYVPGAVMIVNPRLPIARRGGSPVRPLPAVRCHQARQYSEERTHDARTQLRRLLHAVRAPRHPSSISQPILGAAQPSGCSTTFSVQHHRLGAQDTEKQPSSQPEGITAPRTGVRVPDGPFSRARKGHLRCDHQARRTNRGMAVLSARLSACHHRPRWTGLHPRDWGSRRTGLVGSRLELSPLSSVSPLF